MIQSKAIDGQASRRFTGFTQVLSYIRRNEGFYRLYKGLIPQIIKGFLVQGLMMLFKERFVLFNCLNFYKYASNLVYQDRTSSNSLNIFP